MDKIIVNPENPCETNVCGGGANLDSKKEKVHPIARIKNGIKNFMGGEKRSGFTLSETMIVLVVLGIITMLVVPQLIKRQQEVQKRAKIKKAMSVYDYLVNKIVLENDIKSTNGLKTWADADCTNSSSYFKVVKKVDNSKCKFKTSDGVYWDISHIEKPIVALKSGDLKDEIAEAPNSNKAFYFLAKFDDQGNLRVSDVQYEISKGTADDKQAMIKLSNFIKGIKAEGEEPAETCDFACQIAKVKNTPCQNPDEFHSGLCTNCVSCSTNTGYDVSYYDENGNPIFAQYSCTNGENCAWSNIYEYDSNGNMTMMKNNCDGNGENCGFFDKYENGNTVTSIYNCDSSERCSECYGSKCDDYRHTETQDVERQRWVSTGGGGGRVPPPGFGEGYWETYTETVTKTYYKF